MAKAIRHLMQTSNEHNCHFIVGAEKESIGVVKELVAEASEAFRKMLVESDIRERGPVQLPDDHPDAVKIFLKFAYGGMDSMAISAELTGSLSNGETALHVVDFAEKYLVADLKDMALSHLKPTTVDNVFPALHCVAMYNASSLEPLVLEIVKDNTEQVLQHPDFLNICLEAMMYLVQQERLSVPEVVLWKAVVAWAEHNVKPEAGDTLRSVLEKPLKHIRLYNLTSEEFWTSVDPHKVFTKDEICYYCRNVQLKQYSISDVFCSKTDQRNATECIELRPHSDPYLFQCTESIYEINVQHQNVYKPIKLTRLELYQLPHNWTHSMGPSTMVTVKLHQAFRDQPLAEVSFMEQVNPGETLTLPLEGTELGRLWMMPGYLYRLELNSNSKFPADRHNEHIGFAFGVLIRTVTYDSLVKKIYFTRE